MSEQQRIWSLGDYPTIARYLLPISVETVDAIGITPGDRVLDVGVGTGNAAMEAARRGAKVTGVDLTPLQIERAGARSTAEGLDIDLRVGDVQALEFADHEFDVVLSVMGVIFAPDHSRASAEMARVCRPGGTVALTSWARDGWSMLWRSRAAHLIPPPPPGSPTPDEWGDVDEARRRLTAAGLESTVEVRPFLWRFPSVDSAIDTFTTAAGPYVAFMESMRAQGRDEEALAILRSAMEDTNTATDGTVAIPAPYLLAIGHRPA